MAAESRVPSTPSFLGIGAQKAGTSWLAMNLRRHPDIWMPPRKELHYFDRSSEYPSPSHLITEMPLRRLLGTEEPNRRHRREMTRAFLSCVRHCDLQRLVWNARYYLGRYNDSWYISLFAGAAAQVTGEITPAYSILKVGDVAKVHRLLPHLKIIYFVRNPIERVWSQLRFECKKKNKPLETLTLDSVRSHINDSSKHLRGDYLRTLNVWRTFYAPEQIFIGFFDDIENKPRALLNNIFAFLGVDSGKYKDAGLLAERVNASPQLALPPSIRVCLAQEFHDEVGRMCDAFGGQAYVWLRDIEDTLVKGR